MIEHARRRILMETTHAVHRVLSAIILGVLISKSAGAQLAVDKLEMTLRPGDMSERVGVLNVRNEGSAPAQALIKLEDWDRAPDGSNRFYQAGTRPGSCAKSLEVFPKALALQPGESQSVRVEFKGDSVSAECWSLVVIETPTPRVQANGRTVTYNMRTGLKVYAGPAGLRVDGEVTDLAVSTKPDGSGIEADFAAVTFGNTGKRHLATKGRIEIRREDNSLVEVVQMPAIYALPGSTMNASVKLPKLAVGRYILLAVVDFGGDEIAAGMFEYQAR